MCRYQVAQSIAKTDMASLDMCLDSTHVSLMELDLEEYRRAHGLSYAQLASKLGLTWGRHAMRWALGESWPDADKLERIVQATRGEVSVDAMHKRRLAFLASHSDLQTPNAGGPTEALAPDQERDIRKDGEVAGTAGGSLKASGPDRAA
jgi:transcriptional regulator with XRE-family HTH domain